MPWRFSMEKITISVCVPEAVNAKLKEKAEKTGLSKSFIVTQALISYFRKRPNVNEVYLGRSEAFLELKGD